MCVLSVESNLVTHDLVKLTFTDDLFNDECMVLIPYMSVSISRTNHSNKNSSGTSNSDGHCNTYCDS